MYIGKGDKIMKAETLQDMIENTIKDLEQVEYKYYNAYNGKVYQLALYLYGRYGELPAELLDDKKLEKMLNIVDREESLFNENINYYAEDVINDLEEV